MALHIFKKFDRRLAADLRTQRANIVAGLACVVVTSLLTTATIGLVEKSIGAIRDASPIRSVEVPRNAQDLKAKLEHDAMVERLSKNLGLERKRVEAAYASAQEPRVRSREDAIRFLSWLCVAIVGTFAVKYWFTRGQSYFLSKAATELSGDLRRRMYRKIQRLPIAYFNRTRAGEIQSILTNDVTVYQNAVSIIRDSIDGPIKAATALAYIVYTQPWLSLMVVGTFPLMWFVIQRNGKKMRIAQRQVQDDLADLNSVTQESIQGVRVVKAFAAEEKMEATYESAIVQWLRNQLAASRRIASLRPLVELIGATALAIVLYICGMLAFNGRLQIEQIAALIFALDVINQGFRALGNVNSTYNQVQAASERIYGQLLDLPEEHADLRGATKLAEPKGRITFEGVGFSYPDGTVALKGIDFVLEPGESLALVGPSGAGKSTIADLLLRFYDPTEGRITFDGVDIRQLDQTWLRSRIGVVPQQNFLFAGTIAENIRLGAPSATDSEVVEAARQAHADVFVEQLPSTYETFIGEKGIGLSGGEQQRVAIARALARKPTLLLLDEATSALDAQSEKIVQEALDEVMRQRTTLFIAHRLTTAARADRLIVLRRGEIVETGSHRELMEMDGAYAAMYRAFGSGIVDDDIG